MSMVYLRCASSDALSYRYQCAVLIKPLVANFTCVRFIPCECQPVIYQNTTVTKGLVTHFKWALTLAQDRQKATMR